MSHHPTTPAALELRRVTAAALAIVLLLPVGDPTLRGIGLAVMPLPGLAFLVGVAGIAWLLASRSSPRCLARRLRPTALPIAGRTAGRAIRPPRAGRAALLLSAFPSLAAALPLVVGRWVSCAGGISRPDPEGRPDSRIPFLMPQLIEHGTGPYSELAPPCCSLQLLESRPAGRDGQLPGRLPTAPSRRGLPDCRATVDPQASASACDDRFLLHRLLSLGMSRIAAQGARVAHRPSQALRDQRPLVTCRALRASALAPLHRRALVAAQASRSHRYLSTRAVIAPRLACCACRQQLRAT